MVQRVFLTDARRDVLNGEFDGKEITKRSQKSKIRTRSRLAIDELIDVFESDEIDNTKSFDPEQIARLIRALMPHPDEIESFPEYDGTAEEHTNEYSWLYTLLHQIQREVAYGHFLLQHKTPEHLEADSLHIPVTVDPSTLPIDLQYHYNHD